MHVLFLQTRTVYLYNSCDILQLGNCFTYLLLIAVSVLDSQYSFRRDGKGTNEADSMCKVRDEKSCQ